MNKNFYNEIIDKLEQLIKKEYFVLFLLGLLTVLIIIVSIFALLSLFELVAYSKSIVRTILFLIFVFISLASLGYLVIIPLLK